MRCVARLRAWALVLFATSGCAPAGSITLNWPNDGAQRAIRAIEIYSLNVSSKKCVDYSLALAQEGAIKDATPVGAVLVAPFDGQSLPSVLATDTTLAVVAYDHVEVDDRIALLFGCIDGFGGEAGVRDLAVEMRPVVTGAVWIRKLEGDRSVALDGTSPSHRLRLRFHALRDTLATPLPGVVIRFVPEDTKAAINGRPLGETEVVITDEFGDAVVNLDAKSGVGTYRVRATSREAEDACTVARKDNERAICAAQTTTSFAVDVVAPASMRAKPIAKVSGLFDVPIDVAFGRVTQTGERNAVVLGCKQTSPEDRESCARGKQLGGTLGRTKLALLSDLSVEVPKATELAPQANLGVAPGGLFVGPIFSGLRDDIAIANSRRACAWVGCGEGSEIVTLDMEQGAALSRTTLSSSNAVGLHGVNEVEGTTRITTLFTVAQGPRRLAPSAVCDPLRACGECGPGEQCTCADDGSNCACRTVDRRVDQIFNVAPISGGVQFVNRDACLESPCATCACPRPNTSVCRRTRDTCGCLLPHRITTAGSLGHDLALAKLGRDTQGRIDGTWDIVVAASHGLEFIASETTGTRSDAIYAHEATQIPTAPIHRLDIVPLDNNASPDIVWVSQTACTKNVDQAGLCRDVVDPSAGSVAALTSHGCLGTYLREPSEVRAPIDDAAEDGCQRYPLSFAPDGFCVADFNADGRSDVALASFASTEVHVHLGGRNGGFSARPIVVQLPNGMRGGILACDRVDENAGADIVVVGLGGDASLVLSGS